MGVGVGSYGYLYDAYKPANASSFPFLAKPHNQYLQVLAETGITGLVVFSLLIGRLFMLVAQALRATHKDSRYVAVVGGFSGLIGVAIQGYAFGYLVHIYTWILLGLIVGAYRQMQSMNMDAPVMIEARLRKATKKRHVCAAG